MAIQLDIDNSSANQVIVHTVYLVSATMIINIVLIVCSSIMTNMHRNMTTIQYD